MEPNPKTKPSIRFKITSPEPPKELQAFLTEHSILVEEDETPIVEQHIQADRLLWKIHKMQSEIESIEVAMQGSAEFYQRKIEKIQENIKYLEIGLNGFITATGQKTVQLPNGTMRLRKTRKTQYPEDTVLIAFCNQYGISTRVKESPDKKAIQAYIQETGEIPEGYEEEDNVNFTYSLNDINK